MAAEASAFFGFFHADIGPSHDGADHIVEIVRDAACELADGFEFLSLEKLFFEVEALGDVLDDYFGVFGSLFAVDDMAAIEAHG